MSLNRVPKSKADNVEPGFPPWELESVWFHGLVADLTTLNSEIGAMV